MEIEYFEITCFASQLIDRLVGYLFVRGHPTRYKTFEMLPKS